MSATASDIMSVNFNQDKSCFTCALGGPGANGSGVRIYNVSPLCEQMHIDKAVIGSVKLVEMLDRTNLLAIVAGGCTPKYADNSVLIWDDAQKIFVLDVTFNSPVLNVKMSRNRLIVVLLSHIYVFRFPNNVEKLLALDTRENVRGLCALSSSGYGRKLLVFPGYKCGSVQLVEVSSSEQDVSTSPVTINAHKSEIACLSIDAQGRLLATASGKGTLIRVFDAHSKVLLRELRRGSDTADIYCINFSHDSVYLCTSSDKGTVHVFAIKDAELNKKSAFHRMGKVSLLGGSGLGQYMESEWNMAKFTVPAECACICAFGSHSSVIAICVDGTFHRYVFNADGQCNREAFDIFIDMRQDDDI